MADKRVGRAHGGSVVLLITIGTMIALSHTPLFGLEWLYSGGTRVLTIAWEVSPALCLMAIAVAGGTVGHRLAMKEVADQLVRERWDRKRRSTPLEEQHEIHLKPVRISISSSTPPPASADHSQNG